MDLASFAAVIRPLIVTGLKLVVSHTGHRTAVSDWTQCLLHAVRNLA
jgi:hypothetical protein